MPACLKIAGEKRTNQAKLQGLVTFAGSLRSDSFAIGIILFDDPHGWRTIQNPMSPKPSNRGEFLAIETFSLKARAVLAPLVNSARILNSRQTFEQFDFGVQPSSAL